MESQTEKQIYWMNRQGDSRSANRKDPGPPMFTEIQGAKCNMQKKIKQISPKHKELKMNAKIIITSIVEPPPPSCWGRG